MHNRNLRGGHRAPRRNTAAMIALGAAVPVFVVSYFVVPQRTEHAAPAADTGPAASWTSAGAVSATPAGPVSATPAVSPAAVSAGLPDGTSGDTPAGSAAGGPAGTSPGAQEGTPGGWGRGGYPMMDVPGSEGAAGSQGAAGSGGAAGSEGAAGSGGAAGPNAVAAVTSQNWAGYAVTGPAGSVNRVSASWAEPAVNCGAASTFSSFWAGLDGDGTPTVEQTGTEADCVNGAASHQGWYEIFPNAPVFFPNPVQPGDAMSASVVADGGGIFTLTLSDGTQGWTQTTQQVEAAAQLGSAEVIAEAPSDGAVLPLADFGTVNFTGAAVNGAPIGASAIGGGANLSELTMESAAGTVLAAPSALAGGSAFSVAAASGGGTLTPWDDGDQG